MSTSEPTVTHSFTEDLGADPTGSELSDNAIGIINSLDGSVSVSFPPGTYRLSAGTHTIAGPDELTLRFPSPEDDIDDPEAPISGPPRFVAPPNYDGLLLDFRALSLDVRNLALDRLRGGAGGRVRLTTPAGGTVRATGLRLLGRDDADTAVGAQLTVGGGPASTVTLDGLRIAHGASWTDSGLSPSPADGAPTVGRAGLRIAQRNAATVRVLDPFVAQCAGIGIDGRNGTGTLTVRGGVVRENNGPQIRLGRRTDRIENCSLLVDLSRVLTPGTDATDRRVEAIQPDAYTVPGGVMLDRSPAGDEPDAAATGPTIRDLSIGVNDGDLGERTERDGRSVVHPPVTVTPDAAGPRLTFCNLDVAVDGVSAIDARQPAATGTPPNVQRTVIRETRIGGSATTGVAVFSPERHVLIAETCIERPKQRRGVVIPDGDQFSGQLRAVCPLR